jgi:hypothetical protein
MPYIQLQFRRDSSINWISTNPVLASGEMGIELDTHTFKIGDGRLRWVNLPYGGLQGPAGPAGLIPPSGGIPGQILTCTGSRPSDVAWQMPSAALGNSAVIKAPQNGTNFDFTLTNARVTYPVSFGPTPSFGYTAGIGSGNPSDTTGFSILLSSIYNMNNLPIITGTVAYWDGTKMNYMQIKFGNSSSSNSVRATITNTNSLTSVDSNNINTYGAPLRLSVDGVSNTTLNGAQNISNTNPLKYSVVIYLQIVN